MARNVYNAKTFFAAAPQKDTTGQVVCFRECIENGLQIDLFVEPFFYNLKKERILYSSHLEIESIAATDQDEFDKLILQL